MTVATASVRVLNAPPGPGGKGREDVVEQVRPRASGLPEPLGAQHPAGQGRGRRSSSASVRTPSPPPAWLACAAIAARLAPRWRRTSTRWVSSAAAVYAAPQVAVGGQRQHPSQPGQRRSPAAAARGRRWPRARAGCRPARPRGPDPVHLHVVGVAVAAVPVVDRQHVGALLAQDPGQPLAARSRGTREGGSRGAAVPAVTAVPAVPDQPESAYPSTSTRAQPSACGRGVQLAAPALAEVARRRRPAASPASPRVATTSTTRCPSAAARARVPAVSSASSSGWAWKETRCSGRSPLTGGTGVCRGRRHGGGVRRPGRAVERPRGGRRPVPGPAGPTRLCAAMPASAARAVGEQPRPWRAPSRRRRRTSRPVHAGGENSPTPPRLLATTGRPAQRASRAAMPKDSQLGGRDVQLRRRRRPSRIVGARQAAGQLDPVPHPVPLEVALHRRALRAVADQHRPQGSVVRHPGADLAQHPDQGQRPLGAGEAHHAEDHRHRGRPAARCGTCQRAGSTALGSTSTGTSAPSLGGPEPRRPR